MNDWQSPHRSKGSRIPLEILAFVAGLAALVGAAVAYVAQSSESGAFNDDPNYAPALLLLGVGAYLVLLATILFRRPTALNQLLQSRGAAM